jgi:hypothetical protein
MEEDKLKKELRSMGKVKAPGDFLTQVNARLDRGKRAFFPVPLRLATAVTVLIIGFVVYRAVQPSEPIAFKAPGTKMEVAAGRRAMTRAAVPKRAARPAAPLAREMAPAAPAADMMMSLAGAGAGRGMDEEILESPDFNVTVTKVKGLVEHAKGRVILVSYDKESELPQYITVDIPVDNYYTFIEKLEKLGDLKKSFEGEPDHGLLRLRIELTLAK